jgi:hypothetical protein
MMGIANHSSNRKIREQFDEIGPHEQLLAGLKRVFQLTLRAIVLQVGIENSSSTRTKCNSNGMDLAEYTKKVSIIECMVGVGIQNPL